MDLVGDATLAHRVELAEGRLNAMAAHALIGEQSSVQIGTGVAIFGGPSSPITKAIGLGFWGDTPNPSELESGEIEEVEVFYRACGVAPLFALCPLAHPALAPALGRRGYTLEAYENVLVRPATSIAPASSAELDIDDTPPISTWAEVIARGFANNPSPDLVDLGIALGSAPGVVCLLAYVDHEPVGGAAITIHEGVGLLFAASVLPQYRRRGVQTALVQSRIAHATRATTGATPEGGRAAEVDVLALCAAAGSSSQRNAERQGFRVAYTRFELTLLR